MSTVEVADLLATHARAHGPLRPLHPRARASAAGGVAEGAAGGATGEAAGGAAGGATDGAADAAAAAAPPAYPPASEAERELYHQITLRIEAALRTLEAEAIVEAEERAAPTVAPPAIG